MAGGVENLIPQSERTKEEQSRIARMGGKASGKTRRRKKTMKEAIDIFLSKKITSEELRLQMKALGIEPDEMDYQMATIFGMIKGAIEGNPSAFNALRDTVGEKPVDAVDINAGMSESLANIMQSGKGEKLE